jgi:hypothetical protein
MGRQGKGRPGMEPFGGEWLAGVFLLWLGIFSAACAATTPTRLADSRAETSQPVEFSFPASQNEVVSSETTRGRATALAFITTYDMASQLVVRRLGEVIVRFTPRANAAAIVVEPALYAELLPAYRESLSLPFPVVIADFATQQGHGAFGEITSVPTLVVLDRDGREVWRHQGPLTAEQIANALSRASQRSGGI